MPPPAPLFVPPSELVQPWDTLEKTKLGLKFVFDPDRSRHLDPQSEIQRVTDRAIELWYLPLHSCVAECCAGTPPPLLVGVFRKLQHRCQAINRCAHSGPHSSGWVRKQVLLVLVSRKARQDVKPLTVIEMMTASSFVCTGAACSIYIQVYQGLCGA